MAKEILKDDDLFKTTGGTSDSGGVTVEIIFINRLDQKKYAELVTFDSGNNLEYQCLLWCSKKDAQLLSYKKIIN